MRKIAGILLALLSLQGWSQDSESTPSALTCADFRPTPEALMRFPDLIGACEAVVERNGELYGLFRAVVRRANSRSVTLYVPATDHTFSVEPEADARVIVGNRKLRPRELNRGDEIRIYLASSAFARPDVDEIAFVTESEAIITHTVVTTPALPTTASMLPTLAAGSLGLLLAGFALRRLRTRRQASEQGAAS